MNDLQIGNPSAIYLLAIVLVGLGVAVWSAITRRRAAELFTIDRQAAAGVASAATLRYWTSAVLVLTSLALFTLALTDIRWGKQSREVPQKGLEVMFVLDVSRSMLAEDVSPNRLQRAKQQIKDMVEEMTGDRVGLISFAGEARQSVPLTSHYEDFKQTLDAVGPHTVRTGGSRLGDALEAAASGFLSKTNEHKTIVVFTDGEDQESKPQEVARRLYADQGIRIFTVGLGDMDQGARVPKSEDRGSGYVQFEGQQVWSKMNGKLLQQIAQETDAAYIPAGTRRVDMADVYHSYVANVPQGEFETATINAYIPRFQWFAVPALALLLLEVFIGTACRKRAGRRPHVAATKSQPAPRKVA